MRSPVSAWDYLALLKSFFVTLAESWFAGYITRKASIELSYTATESVCAEDQVRGDHVEAAFVESLPTAANSQNGLKGFPAFLTASVIIANVRNSTDGNVSLPVVLTREVLAGIFNNSITNWNHDLIAEENDDFAEYLPADNITIVILGGESCTSAASCVLYVLRGFYTIFPELCVLIVCLS